MTEPGSAIRGIVSCLWFDREAEEAAHYYCSIFPNSRIGAISYFGKEGFEIHGQPEGTVQAVNFELDGHPFMIINGGPMFKVNQAVSFQVMCESQEQIDYYWDKLTAGGDPSAQACGWLKDKYGLSWQVVPVDLDQWVGDPRSQQSQRAMRALLQMSKIDIAAIKRAYEG